ncbi:phosphoribosylaminoimidazolesuccinocarboxamide synthase [bacterium]|nr:phosphoribosylaminoimidazolesuccinocarboxamide synthase [bacterium]
MSDGRVLYVGKTKDVLRLPQSRYIGFRFKDNVLGRAGVPDSGGNEVVGQEAGKGALACAIACRIFERLAEAGVTTHFVERLSEDSIMVRRTEPIRIEFISRNFAYGHYLRTHPGVRSLAEIPGTRELTLKDDASDDPPLSEKEAVDRGLIQKEELVRALDFLDRVTGVLTAFYTEKNLRLCDLKLEVGRSPDSPGLMVIDDLGYDNSRIFSGEHLLDARKLHAALGL